jgi:aerobic C4-dicarboxylate transport protein
MHSHLNNETDDEADDPESVLIEDEEAVGIGAASRART